MVKEKWTVEFEIDPDELGPDQFYDEHYCDEVHDDGIARCMYGTCHVYFPWKLIKKERSSVQIMETREEIRQECDRVIKEMDKAFTKYKDVKNNIGDTVNLFAEYEFYRGKCNALDWVLGVLKPHE